MEQAVSTAQDWRMASAEEELQRLDRALRAADVPAAELWRSNVVEALDLCRHAGDREALEQLLDAMRAGDLDAVRELVQAICLPARQARLALLGIDDEEVAGLSWDPLPPPAGTDPRQRFHARVQLALDAVHDLLPGDLQQQLRAGWSPARKSKRAAAVGEVAAPGPVPWLMCCPHCEAPVVHDGGATVPCPRCGARLSLHDLLPRALRQALAQLVPPFMHLRQMAREQARLEPAAARESVAQIGLPPAPGESVGRSVTVAQLARRQGKQGSTRGRAPDPAALYLLYSLARLLAQFSDPTILGSAHARWSYNERLELLDGLRQFIHKVGTTAYQLRSDKREELVAAMAGWQPRPRGFRAVEQALKRAREAVAG